MPLTPHQTGNLRRSEGERVEGSGWDVVGVLYATASYAKFVHDGTGIYGPEKRPAVYFRRPARMHVSKLRFWKTKTRKQTRLVYSDSGLKYVRTVQKYKQLKSKKVTVGSRSGGGTAIKCVLMGMKGRPFFQLALLKLVDQLPQIFRQGAVETMQRDRK